MTRPIQANPINARLIQARSIQAGLDTDEVCRYFYNLNGTDNVIETGQKFLNDVFSGDFFIEFGIEKVPSLSGAIVSQNVSSTKTEMEFQISKNAGVFEIVFAGEIVTTTTLVEKAFYRFDFNGSTEIVISRDGQQVETISVTAGSASEPISTFTIGAAHNDDIASYAQFSDGIIYNININESAYYAVDDNSSTIKDSVGSNDAELLNVIAENWEIICDDKPVDNNRWFDGNQWFDGRKFFD